MDFFEHQAAARRASRRLVVLFALAVAAVTAAVYVVARVLFVGFGDRASPEREVMLPLAVAAGALLLIAVGTLYKTAVLRAGGRPVARRLGGVEISSDSRAADERRLLHVVEEMAIAAGMPVPPVYVLEKEPGINAFAAGHTPGDAVLGVTDGCLRLLSRDELQGVVAHELSHVFHGDMRLNLRLIGLLHGLLLLSLVGRGILESSRFSGRGGRRRDGGAALMLFGLALIALGYLGVFCGRLIKSAVSRQREFLADASAVQFTRNPAGVAGALKKIGGLAVGSHLDTPRAEEASHMFFANALGPTVSRLQSTHPPLAERIRRIDPSFDGIFPDVRRPEPVAAPAPAPRLAAPAATPAAHPTVAAPADLATLVASIGTLDREHLAYAAALLADLPPGLAERAHGRTGAEALVYALLLDPDDDLRRRQLEALKATTRAAVLAETRAAYEILAACPQEAVLPLVDLALPSLRRLPATSLQDFERNVQTLVAADGKLGLRELVLRQIVRRHVLRHLDERPPAAQYYSLKRLGGETGALLSALARAGSDDPAAAFAAGARLLPEVELAFTPDAPTAALETALEPLALLAPRLKRRLLQAAAAAVLHDRRVTVGEGELLRAVAETLDCPMPPLLPGQRLAAEKPGSVAVEA